MIRPAHRPRVSPGPLLLSAVPTRGDHHDGTPPGPQSHAAHRQALGDVPVLSVGELLDLTGSAAIRGRGGAGFPFARKIATVAEHTRPRAGRLPSRPSIVVNASEGEPASAKDSALLLHVPHLVLDGAVVAARALGAREIHVVTGQERPAVAAATAAALAERDDTQIRLRHHQAPAHFVAGQAQAVLQLLSGRAALPVTAWAPEAVRGHRGRPTLLSNAETFAHLGALALHGPDRYADLGTPQEPGTTLLTVTTARGPDAVMPTPDVLEVEHGTPFVDVLAEWALSRPILVGGFHGTWAPPDGLREVRVSAADLTARGQSLGAGVLLAVDPLACPVEVTAHLVRYLAGQSAGRCGPCRLGLPSLADEMAALACGVDTRTQILDLARVVTGRGACAHPDGTARLVLSLVQHLGDEVQSHLRGHCACAGAAVLAS